MSDLRILDVEISGERVDVHVERGTITAIGHRLGAHSGATVHGDGGALIPGLWDHHIHLLALAAALGSVSLGPPHVHGPAQFAEAVRTEARRLAPGRWLRGVGQHDSLSGDIDRWTLDAIVADRPVRIQHRSGARWTLNSAGCDALALDADGFAGIERDDHGRATGRITGGDDWLGARLGATVPDLAAVGRRLSALGVVGVTDATPAHDTSGWEMLATAARRGDLHQHIVVTGGPDLTWTTPPAPLAPGPVKIYLADHGLPSFDDLLDIIVTARQAGRAVAFHSVTRASLALALAALDAVGAISGDRIEHGAVIPPELADAVAARRLTVVTQPGFVAERGDHYLTEVEGDDLPHLYPCAALLDRGIAVGGSTDAPFTDGDPWAAMRAAVARTTRQGIPLGPSEAVTPQRALELFLGRPEQPGGPPRRVEVEAPADLCVLKVPLSDARNHLHPDIVAATVVGGVVVSE